MILISDSNEPSYTKMDKYNQRDGACREINIENIEAHVKGIQNDLQVFLSEYSKHFIEIIFNKYIPVAELCIKTDESLHSVNTQNSKDFS